MEKTSLRLMENSVENKLLESDVLQEETKNGNFYLSENLTRSIDKYNSIVKDTSSLLLIFGEAGSGKTEFFKNYKTVAIKESVICQFNAEWLESPYHLLEIMQKKFPINEVNQDKSGLKKLVIFWQSSIENQQIPVLLIDDAHLLSDRLLETLFRLHKLKDLNGRSLVRIVLLSEQLLSNRLCPGENLSMSEKDIVEIPFPSFSFYDTEQYLMQHVLARSSGGIDSFSISELARLHQQSNGRPKKLNEFSDKLIKFKVQRLASQKKISPRKLKFLGPMAAAVLTISFGYYFISGSIRQNSPIAIGESALIPLSPVQRAPIRSLLISEAKVNPKHVEEFINPLITEKLLTSPDDEVLVKRRDQIATRVSVTSLDETTQAFKERASQPIMFDASVSTHSGFNIVNEHKDAHSSKVYSENATGGDSLIARLKLGAESQVPNEAKVNPKQQAQSVDKDVQMSVKSWINKQPSNSYTIQLIAGSDKSKILKFMSKNHSSEHVIYFHTIKKNAAWYAVLQGEFKTLAETEKARELLPERLTIHGPWIRKFSSIQKEISISEENVNLISTSFASAD